MRLRRILFAAALTTASASAVQAEYIVTQISSGGRLGDARGINDLGHVVGAFVDEDWKSRSFVYADGVSNLLTAPAEGDLFVSDLNDAGQVVGHVNRRGDSIAVVSSGSGWTELGTFGGYSSSAAAINAAGVVVGFSSVVGGLERAFVYADGQMKAIEGVGSGHSRAHDVNDAGQIVGQYLNAAGEYRAFLASGGAATGLAGLENLQSYARGINDVGEVVGGFHASSGAVHAFLHSEGALLDLGTLGGTYAMANDVNALGQVVGVSSIVGTSAYRGFLYTDGAMWNLNDLIVPGSGWTITAALGINDSGAIAAVGTHSLYGQQALLLTRNESPAVPEPSSLALSAMAAALLTCLARRGRRGARGQRAAGG